MKERGLVDADLRRANSDFMAHEYAHSWDGKYRRPRGLATPDYQEPMRGDLLWVYEGLTQYLGWVLATRSRTWSVDDARTALADAIVNPERIDQGVDYAGVGKLVAIGAGRITYLSADNDGWPGAFIEYRLLDGADAGCYVYYAEGVTPADGLRVGQTIGAGQPIATIIPVYPTGIEIGWGAGIATNAYAKVAGQWSPVDDQDDLPSAAGKSFSALIAALGGPPGKNEGGR